MYNKVEIELSKVLSDFHKFIIKQLQQLKRLTAIAYIHFQITNKTMNEIDKLLKKLKQDQNTLLENFREEVLRIQSGQSKKYVYFNQVISKFMFTFEYNY